MHPPMATPLLPPISTPSLSFFFFQGGVWHCWEGWDVVVSDSRVASGSLFFSQV